VPQEPHDGAYVNSLNWAYCRQGRRDLA